MNIKKAYSSINLCLFKASYTLLIAFYVLIQYDLVIMFHWFHGVPCYYFCLMFNIGCIQ